MIDIDKYDNEGIELSDGGTICFPETDGRMERIDKDGNTMEVRYQSTNNEGQEWYVLFDTRQDLLAEVKRLRKVIYDALYVLQTDGWNKNRADAINRLEKLLINGWDGEEE